MPSMFVSHQQMKIEVHQKLDLYPFCMRLEDIPNTLNDDECARAAKDFSYNIHMQY